MVKMISLFWLAGCLLLSQAAEAKQTVTDGDSIVLNGVRIRLLGIDAPEYRQQCYDAGGKGYDCGLRAKEELIRLIGRAKVVCDSEQKDIYNRDLSTCYANGINLNRRMLENGWAVAYRTEREDYLAAEQQAKKNKRGIWQGKFMKPELYRILSK